MTGSVNDALRDMWRSVLLFIPAALAFVAILIAGYVLARLLRTGVAKALHKAGFDRVVERGAAGRALGERIAPSQLCAKIVFYAVLLVALQLAFGIWGPNPVSDLLTALVSWLPRAFVAVVIVVVAAAVGGAARDLIGSALGGLPYGRLLARVAYGTILGLGSIAALDQVGIATAVTRPVLIAVLATVAGVVIVGVGGGLIRPMQGRWEVWLERAGTESAVIREHAREARRAAAEEKAREEARRIVEEQERRAREEARLAEEEARRAEEEARRAEEEQRRAAEEAEAQRVAAAREEEERRLHELREQEEQKARRDAQEREARLAEEQRRIRQAEREREGRLAEQARASGDQTVIIPMQRTPRDSHPVPGFGDDRTEPLGPVGDRTEPLGPVDERTEPLGREDPGRPDDGGDERDRPPAT